MDAVLTSFVDQIQAAAAATAPLRMAGGGTKAFLAPQPQGAVLDTRSFTGITSYEPSELVVTVRAGTPLAELEAALAEKNQCLPFEPPRFAPGGTVGGLVAAGLSGPSRANVGSVRDHVLGLSMLNGRAEYLTFGGQVMKNVAGYDLSRLMVGAYGTLGLLTEISLKVLPFAAAEATLAFDMDQAHALQVLHRWGGRPLPLNASSWHQQGDTGVLLLRLRGAEAAVEDACQTLGGHRLDPAQAATQWTLRRDHQLAWFTVRRQGGQALDLWRLSVPQTAPVLDLPEAPLVEWHGGQRWVHAQADQAEQVRAVALACGGSASLFVASAAQSTADRSLLQGMAGPLVGIHRALKQQFDPAGIFNRGRLAQDL